MLFLISTSNCESRLDGAYLKKKKGNKRLIRDLKLFDLIVQSVDYGQRSFISGYGRYDLTKIQINP